MTCMVATYVAINGNSLFGCVFITWKEERNFGYYVNSVANVVLNGVAAILAATYVSVVEENDAKH